MIKVRATKDGVYGGYYRKGPQETNSGTIPGEVFEVDEVPYEVMDEHNRPMPELDIDEKKIPVMAGGKQKMDANGRPMFKVRMASFFTTEWMERVPDETEVTNDYPAIEDVRKHGPLSFYREKPAKGQKAVSVAVPAVPVESPI